MATNKDWDQILAQALQEDLDAKMAQLPPENEVDFEFSEEFESDMQKLLNRASKPYYYFINTVGKRVAIIAVVLFIALTTTVFSVEALRKPVIEFFVTVFEQFSVVVFGEEPNEKMPSDDYYIPPQKDNSSSSEISSITESQNITSSKVIFSEKQISEVSSNIQNNFHDISSSVTSYEVVSSRPQQESSRSSVSSSSSLAFSSSQALNSESVSSRQEPKPNFPQTIEKLCLPTIPEGYLLDFEEKTNLSYYAEYINENHEFISFEQYVIQSNKISIDTEEVVPFELEINGFQAIYYENKGISCLIWTDSEYGYCISGIANQEFLFEIAQSVKKESIPSQ